ncbi:hypothetical protein [Listeria booriae]|uniref:hypothetical protein n=1 Tax=Listeria booriae TaxID=1552123 RepID=UPI0016285EFB|nr:hypothetical protein [Listeria booriae]MBC2036860.1 hypothetical protein [Listeria booriae]
MITKDYIEKSDQEQLKKQLNKLDMPILFSDFDAKSAAVFAIPDTSKDALHELYEKIARISK